MNSRTGRELLDFATELYPICRSITGNGLRQTLRLVKARIPLRIHEVRSGSKVFDWEVPPEWNIEGASIRGPDGRTVVDFRDHNLHVVGYSEPVDLRLDLEELKRHLHVHAGNPDWIPYRTSYYTRRWGFCLPRRQLEGLPRGQYHAVVSGRLAPGSLSYGEFVLPGATREEVLFFTHACHPSLANDNTTGIAIATRLAGWLAESRRRYSYRIVFAPGTIGSLCWLKRNERHLGQVRYGLVLGLLGDAAPLTYKESRRGAAEIDVIAKLVLAEFEPERRVIPFEPYGYDERQLCSPGFDLPVGRLTRSVNDGYREYHSSADNLSLLSADSLGRSFEACQRLVMAIESNRRYVNLSPRGEPRLGKRGLYGATGGQSPAERELAMLWVLSQSDGSQSLLEIAAKSKLSFETIRNAASELETAKLLRAKAAPRRRKR
jgi:aminopeptidase-like protein